MRVNQIPEESDLGAPREPELVELEPADQEMFSNMTKLGVWIRLWIDKMQTQSPSLHLECLQGWRGLVDHFNGRPLKVGTMFSGCEIVHHVIEALFQ